MMPELLRLQCFNMQWHDLRQVEGFRFPAQILGAEWKALWFFGNDGAPLNSYQDEELLDIFYNGSFSSKPWNELGQLASYGDALQNYTNALKHFLDLDAIRETTV